jgi:hypothetical protein
MENRDIDKAENVYRTFDEYREKFYGRLEPQDTDQDDDLASFSRRLARDLVNRK